MASRRLSITLTSDPSWFIVLVLPHLHFLNYALHGKAVKAAPFYLSSQESEHLS
ncbi:hypothetical protein BVRB_5g099090 [Beta vulgaris subsp. vulgaris]|nr:hypothetical protein BVRB_5g099090 [Beta vulgaris subsp. vulgaris]